MATHNKVNLFKDKDAERAYFLSGSEDADFNIRKACASMKRMSSIATACVLSGAEPKHLADRVEYISIEILKKLGFPTEDKRQIGALLAMVAEPVSIVVAECEVSGAPEDEVIRSTSIIVSSMIEIARSKLASNIIIERYPADMGASTALRMSISSAITPVSVEAVDFDFCIGEGKCIKEASGQIIRAAFEAADFLAEEEASLSGKLSLTQSLLQAAGKIYAACFRKVATETRFLLEQMSDEEQAVKVGIMENTPAHEALRSVTERFHNLFDACVNQYVEVPEVEIKSTRSLRPRF